MSTESLRRFLEAAILTSGGPVTAESLAEALAEEDRTTEAAERELEAMRGCWEAEERGVRLERVAAGWRCVTIPELDDSLRALHGLNARQKLSQAALEVLSIVAYRQPVTLPEINFIRGANSTAVTRTLMDRGLLRMAGRKKVVGKPFLYRTTKQFLVHFGLDSIKELPEPEALIGETEPEPS